MQNQYTAIEKELNDLAEAFAAGNVDTSLSSTIKTIIQSLYESPSIKKGHAQVEQNIKAYQEKLADYMEEYQSVLSDLSQKQEMSLIHLKY